jgi:hypothetical protein
MWNLIVSQLGIVRIKGRWAVAVKYFSRGEGSILTYLLHRTESFLTSFHLVKKFPAFYGTRSFITAFTSARQLSLS